MVQGDGGGGILKTYANWMELRSIADNDWFGIKSNSFNVQSDERFKSDIADLDIDIIENLDSLPLRPARVKWFDKSKGFGFANIFGYSEDVFIHIEVLRHSGFADLAIGEALCLRIVEGPRGLMAAQIAAWDAAQTTHDEKAQAESLHNSLPHVAE